MMMTTLHVTFVVACIDCEWMMMGRKVCLVCMCCMYGNATTQNNQCAF